MSIPKFELLEDSDISRLRLQYVPNECPICHAKISPEPALVYDKDEFLSIKREIVFLCPNKICNELFIGYYKENKDGYPYMEFELQDLKPSNLKDYLFEKNIKDLSGNFVEIYNQAYKAEQMGLNEICGVGYRKALEFLIKDYMITKNPEESEKISKALLGNCISTWIDDERIKSVAQRAVWLGNDETHYLRRWVDKDIEDLKILIRLTVHWILMELLTKNYIDEMP